MQKLKWENMIDGVTSLSAQPINELANAIKRLENMVAPNRVLSKCKHCGQWGAAMCECKFCGAPIDTED